MADDLKCGHVRLYSHCWRGATEHTPCMICERDELKSKLDAYEKGHSVELERTKGELAAARSRLGAAGTRIAAQEDELLQATRDLEVAREALCQIANGIPGPCLHATEALQAIAVERQSPNLPQCVGFDSGLRCQNNAMIGDTRCRVHQSERHASKVIYAKCARCQYEAWGVDGAILTCPECYVGLTPSSE